MPLEIIERHGYSIEELYRAPRSRPQFRAA